MDYTRTAADGQLVFTQSSEFLSIPSCLYGFHNSETTEETAGSGRTVFVFLGNLSVDEADRRCSCGKRMHINSCRKTTLRHLCFGGNLSCVTFTRLQFRCPSCDSTHMQHVPFKAEGHQITQELWQYVRDLLATGTYTNKQVAEITGLGKNVVKAIDKARLQELYTVKGEKLAKPEQPAKILGIDEFKLHNGYHYATHIMDLETGHILWIAHGKRKQVVYDFIEHVGLDWMESVEAVACDMNSDFEEAFLEKCPHLSVVYDRFHIVKHLNEDVIGNVRKDEQKRLKDEGDEEAAKALKGSKYILIANRSTLQERDAAEGSIVHKGSPLFGTGDVVRKGGREARYDAILSQNELLFKADYLKDALKVAYGRTNSALMKEDIQKAIEVCNSVDNAHFKKFGRMLSRHLDGIVSHATFHISSGKVEGTNQMIKTLRRHGYGYPDDEYFFLKIMDASRHAYVRNPKSNKITHKK